MFRTNTSTTPDDDGNFGKSGRLVPLEAWPWQKSKFGSLISANFGDLVPCARRNAWSRFSRAAFAGTKPRDSPKSGYQTYDLATKRYQTHDFASIFPQRGTKPPISPALRPAQYQTCDPGIGVPRYVEFTIELRRSVRQGSGSCYTTIIAIAHTVTI